MIFTSIVPLPFYSSSFYIVTYIIALIASFSFFTKKNTNTNREEYRSIFLMFAVVLYMGLRPISYWFGDMMNYNKDFIAYQNNIDLNNSMDWLWGMFIKNSSTLITAEMFFFLCAILYIVPLYAVCKKWFQGNKYIPFLMLIVSFSFWAYGVNGIRNGIATSLFLLAYSRDNKIIKYLLFIAAFGFHKSALLVIAAYFLTHLYNNPKHYITGWISCIPLSLALGGFFTSFFLTLGIVDESNVAGYLGDFNYAGEGVTNFKVGFRWDFLIYSATGVFAGWYFILKKQFKDPIYVKLFNIYVTVNGFWILVIKANYSNRFAYLSWFMLALIIFYPFFKKRILVKQNQVIAYFLIAYASFTLLMNVILA